LIRITGSILSDPPRRIGLSPHTCHNSANATTCRSFRSLRESNLVWKRIDCVNSRQIGQE
jgi:hypothetical protein